MGFSGWSNQLRHVFFVGDQISYVLGFCWWSNHSMFITMQTTQIVSVCVSLITAHNAYTSTNKTQIIQTETELTFYHGRRCPMFTCMLQCYAASTVLVLQLCANFVAGAKSVRHTGVSSAQRHRDKGCLSNGLTSYSRVSYSRVPKSKTWSVGVCLKRVTVKTEDRKRKKWKVLPALMASIAL